MSAIEIGIADDPADAIRDGRAELLREILHRRTSRCEACGATGEVARVEVGGHPINQYGTKPAWGDPAPLQMRRLCRLCRSEWGPYRPENVSFFGGRQSEPLSEARYRGQYGVEFEEDES